MLNQLKNTYHNELIIHPGETILEMIQERNISQKELAIRTGYTEKHISTVINGTKGISSDFAKQLEYALAIDASFWRNLQTNYDLELIEYNEKHNISLEEIKISLDIKPVVKSLLPKFTLSNSKGELVNELRHLLGISNLKAIKDINKAYYRTKYTNDTSEYKMYAFQYILEKITEDQVNENLDKNKLINSLDQIKAVMHLDTNLHIEELQKILNDCGVIFTVQKHIKGAPINGLTVKTKKGKVMIALTLRGAYLDIFWFTLFHEIAHIINDDVNTIQTTNKIKESQERAANEFAANILIDKDLYKEFILKQEFSEKSINDFAKTNNVLPTIVIGRLMNDEIIDWNKNGKRLKYVLE